MAPHEAALALEWVASESNVIRTLTQRLQDQRRARWQEVEELRRALAVAHAELLRLRRETAVARQMDDPWHDLHMKPVICRPEQGETISLGPSRTRFLAQQSDTEQLSVTDSVLAPGFPGPVSHRHEHTFDVFFVLEGTVTFRLEGEMLELPAGSFVLVPPGNVHTFANPGDKPARLLNIQTPAGLEQYLKEVAAAAAATGRPPDPAQMAEIASRYDFLPA